MQKKENKSHFFHLSNLTLKLLSDKKIIILPSFKLSKYLDSFGDLVDILGLDEGLEVILQDLGEEVLQLRAPKVGKDLRPVGGVLSTDTQQTPLRYFPLYLPVRKNRHKSMLLLSLLAYHMQVCHLNTEGSE